MQLASRPRIYFSIQSINRVLCCNYDEKHLTAIVKTYLLGDDEPIWPLSFTAPFTAEAPVSTFHTFQVHQILHVPYPDFPPFPLLSIINLKEISFTLSPCLRMNKRRTGIAVRMNVAFRRESPVWTSFNIWLSSATDSRDDAVRWQECSTAWQPLDSCSW